MRTVILRAVVAGVLLMDLALIALVAYLAFIFPKTAAVWADKAEPLSTGQAWLVQASSFCSAYGLVLLPALALATGFSLFALWVTCVRRT